MNSPTGTFPAPGFRALAHSIRRALVVALAVVMAAGLGSASAQTVDGDPPGRVARLSEVTGNVWLYHPDSGDWLQATRNLPLTSGDTLATDPGARAELQVGSATLRLDSGSEVQVVALDDSRLSLQLQAGTLSARVRNAAETGPFDVTTEEGRFLVTSAGRYRFDRGTGSSFVGVDTGQVRFEYGTSALNVAAGQRAEFWIDANGAAQYGLGPAVYDAFTAWNNDRDRGSDRTVATARYVSPEMTGAEDLDRYGNWEQSPEYGAVWIPAAVAVDWAPYSTGHWAWVRPWGWTWIDDAPWGFAPFHYGRWVNLRNRWCWTPGERQPRPVYAPALVGWIGAPRGGVVAAPGVGPAVGWFPLAPREVYVPSYRYSPRYARNINIPFVRNVESINVVIGNPSAPRDFENRHFPRAVTVVPTNVFAERRPVGSAAAQYRDAPWARDFARQGGPAPVLTAPPVAAPQAPAARQADNRPARPAPGFPEQRGAAPGQPFREREGRRGEAPPPGVAALPSPGMAPAPAAVAPVAPQADTSARVRPLPIRPSGVDPAGRDGQPRGAQEQFRPATPAPSPAEQLPPSVSPPGVLPDVPAARVRPLPITRPQRTGEQPPVPGQRTERDGERRGDDDRRPSLTRGERGPDAGRSLPQPAQAPPAAAPVLLPTRPLPTRPVEAPRPAEVRPVEAPRPAEVRPAEPPRSSEVARPAPVAAPRPAEPPRPAPAPAVVIPERRIESPRPAPAPPGTGPERRNEPNANR